MFTFVKARVGVARLRDFLLLPEITKFTTDVGRSDMVISIFIELFCFICIIIGINISSNNYLGINECSSNMRREVGLHLFIYLYSVLLNFTGCTTYSVM